MTSTKSKEDAVDLDLTEDAAPAPMEAAGEPTVDVDEGAKGDFTALPEGVIQNSDGSVTVPFDFPVPLTVRKAGGDVVEEKVTKLVLHRLKGADMNAIGAVPQEKLTVVAFARSARITQQRMDVIYDRMDSSDIDRCGEVIGFFVKRGRRTGK